MGFDLKDYLLKRMLFICLIFNQLLAGILPDYM